MLAKLPYIISFTSSEVQNDNSLCAIFTIIFVDRVFVDNFLCYLLHFVVVCAASVGCSAKAKLSLLYDIDTI